MSVCLCLFVCFCLFSFAFIICIGILSVCFVSVCFIFFSPSLLCCVVYRALVLQSGIIPESQNWEAQIKNVCPPENSQPHGILISESSPKGLHHDTKLWPHPKASKLQHQTPHTKQLAKQEYNPTH